MQRRAGIPGLGPVRMSVRMREGSRRGNGNVQKREHAEDFTRAPTIVNALDISSIRSQRKEPFLCFCVSVVETYRRKQIIFAGSDHQSRDYMNAQEIEVLKTYELDGGSTVKVFKPFGEGCYSAIVDQRGRYPAPGKIARNSGRREYSLLLSGSLTYTVDGVSRVLHANDTILVGDGQTYFIDGEGQALVMVQEGPGGKTLILDE